MPINKEKIHQPVVRAAIEALEDGDLHTWLHLFTPDASLYDDGRKIDLKEFSRNALGKERFTSIDKVENEGWDIYGQFHSDQWGDFKTFFRFSTDENGKIVRLEIGQANY
jgi:hypothetical protein